MQLKVTMRAPSLHKPGLEGGRFAGKSAFAAWEVLGLSRLFSAYVVHGGTTAEQADQTGVGRR